MNEDEGEADDQAEDRKFLGKSNDPSYSTPSHTILLSEFTRDSIHELTKHEDEDPFTWWWIFTSSLSDITVLHRR